MPRTVDEAFALMLANLTPSTTETLKAARHRASIQSCLQANFGLNNFFRSGSFGHGTSVSGYSDIDYFAVLPTGQFSANSAATLQYVRRALAQRFPFSGATVRSPAVVIPFGASISERHEITPADYNYTTRSGYDVYWIPDRTRGWMSASPRAHNAWVNGANAQVGGVKALIRLVKAWNYVRDARIRSFYLELRTTEYALGEKEIWYKYDFLGTLRHLRNKALASMQDPMGIAGLVPACNPGVLLTALSKINSAIVRAEKALEAEQQNKIPMAFMLWKMVFGAGFPSYR